MKTKQIAEIMDRYNWTNEYSHKDWLLDGLVILTECLTDETTLDYAVGHDIIYVGPPKNIERSMRLTEDILIELSKHNWSWDSENECFFHYV